MKILLVVHGLRPEFTGGCELYVEHLARGLISAGHACAVLAGTGAGTSAEESGISSSDFDGLRVHRLRRPDRLVDLWTEGYSAFAERRLREFLAAERFDVVHVHHWKRLTVNLAQICAEQGIPAVVSLHDLWSTCPREDRLLGDVVCEEPAGGSACPACLGSFWWQDGTTEVARNIDVEMKMIRAELSTAARRLVPTVAHRDRVARVFGLPPEEFDVVPLALPESRWLASRERPQEGPGFPEGPLRAAFWGHLVPFKGPHLLLEALDHVRRPERVETHLFGETVSRAYKLTLDRLRRRKAVTMHGAFGPRDLRDVPIDVAVFPSLCVESHSLVLDEAFGMGIPVLAADAGSFPERIGKGGLLFERGSASDLASQIDRLIEEPGLLEELRRGIPSREGAHREHVERLEAIYREAIAGETPAATSIPYLDLLEDRMQALEARRELMGALKERADRAEDLEANLLRYREINRTLDKERREQRMVISDLEANLSGHRDSLQARDRELAELRRVVGDIEADLEGHRTVLRECRSENEQLKNVLNTVQEDLAGHRGVVAALREDLERHRAVVADLSEERGRLLGSLEETTGMLREKTEALARTEARLQERQGELADSVARCRALEDRVRDREERMAELERRLSELEGTLWYKIYRRISPKARSRWSSETSRAER
jgi:glycosyltransferase involved in cell wall biosynthesis